MIFMVRKKGIKYAVFSVFLFFARKCLGVILFSTCVRYGINDAMTSSTDKVSKIVGCGTTVPLGQPLEPPLSLLLWSLF